MALVVKDRVQETTTTSGTGTLTLLGSVAGFQSFSGSIGNGNITFYTIYDNTAQVWEVGVGTVGAGTLARTTVLSNSSGTTSPINLPGNTSSVFCTYPAEKSINYDANDVATIGETLGYSDTGIIGSFASTVAGYNQVVVQNKSTATNASTNFNVSNDAGTSGSNYAELGINSSTFVGTGSFNIAGASYVASASTDLTLGTYGAYSIHFVTNSNTTDAMTIYNNGGVSLGTFGNPGIKNIAASKFVPGYSAVTSAAGTTVLTADSNYYQNLVGSTTQTFQLPDATTLLVGTTFIFDNNSTGVLTIVDNASGSVDTLPSGAAGFVYLANNSTVAGSWNRHSFLPVTYDFNATTANFGNAAITNAVWNGTTIGTGYGGTGLTTFGAANYAIYSTSSSALAAGTLPIAAGGTGQITANAAFNALAPSQTSANGKYLTSDGTNSSWATVTQTTFSAGTTGFTPNTATSGAVTLAGTLNAVNGGTGFATYTTGDIIYASATNTLSKLSAGTNGQILTLASGVPSWAANSAATSRTTTTFTATAGQTTFTVSYNVGYIDIFRNGVRLATGDYTATNGTTVVLATGANLGDTVEMVAYSSLSVAGGVTSFSAGSTGLTPSAVSAGAITLGGTLAVANGGTGVTSSTGSGNNVLSTSPTLVTPVLGTPTSGTLTNCTGYTTANLSGNINLASQVTGTLPVANGGTGVTTSTGTGSTVLSASPTFTGTVVAPTINAGAATALTLQSAGTTAVTIDTSQNVGIGTTTPTSYLSVNVVSTSNGINVGDFNSGGGTGAIPVIQTLGSRNDGNGTFQGRFGAAYRRFDGTAIVSGTTLGTYAFGGQYGTATTYTSANLLYAASINGEAEGSFTASSAMATALVFKTGSTGNALSSVNLSYGTERMRIDSSGRVTMPYQPAFEAVLTTGPGVQYTSGNSEIVFNVANLNIGSCYNTSTGRFTAPVAGVYLFSMFGMTQATSWYVIRKNGAIPSTPTNPYATSAGTVWAQASCTSIFNLAAGDYISIFTGASGSGIYGGGNNHNVFCGRLVS